MSEEKKSTREHEIVIVISAPPEKVWAAISEAEAIVRWFAPEARVEPGEGGSISLSWGPGMEGSEKIAIWDPPRRLRTGGAPKVVDYFLEGKGGRTVLRLVHSGFGAEASFDDEYESTGAGWRMFLSMLKNDLERHAAEKARQVAVFRALDLPAEEARRRMWSHEGLGFEGGFGSLQVGSRYRALAGTGEVLEGEVVAHPAPGHLCLTVGTNALLALFVEKAQQQTYLTISWILYGEAIDSAEAVRSRWAALIGKLFPELTA